MKSAGLTVVLLAALTAPAGAQRARPAAASPAAAAAQELSAGWGALAAGRTEAAEAVAERLLQAGPRRHEALSLKIAARVQAGHPETALDDYEQWVKGAPHEDVFLLQPIAVGVVEALTRAADVGVRVDALQALAEAGDATAAARLGSIAAERPGIADEALARANNPEAIARLSRRVAAPNPRADMSGAIDTLAAVNAPGAAATFAAALDPARAMPTKMAAARALAKIGATDAIPQLRRALQDPDPPVRMTAAAALARLGDASGADLVREMENSPVADIRLMAAEVAAPGNPAGAWVGTATGVLNDVDPLARLSAARLLVAHAADPAAGLAVLNAALADPNPALRLAAVRAVETFPREILGNDVPTLRRLLRDPDPRVRILAAGALLTLAGGV